MTPHNLPVQPTPFVGRTQELAEIAALLADPTCRLLTLVGPGGIGKTRLALEAAAQLEAYPDGIYFVPLQSLVSPDHIVSTIAEAVDFQFYPGGESRQQLFDYFREKSLLLVLDNFEHLLDGVEIVSNILNHAPQIKILATSRETLNLHEEWLVQVKGMHFPEAEPLDKIENYSAVRLFVQNARRVRPDFSLVEEREAVIRICQLVEGLPLALEMTAAWLKRLPCQEIAAEIARGLDILESPARNVSPRHRSMRAVFEHSWNLLTSAERDVFKKLSVFRGRFRKEAAQAVAGASLKVLSALVDKSLLRVDNTGRYDLHELLRQYAEEQLNTSPQESDQTRDLHCAYYAEFMHEREVDMKGRRQLAALSEIGADFENVRAAWLWALRQQHYNAINHTLESLFLFCEMRGRFQEGGELFQQVQLQLTVAPDDSLCPIWGRIVSRGLWLGKSQGGISEQPEVVKTQVEASLRIARKCGNQAESAFCLLMLGSYHFLIKDYRSTLPYLEQSLTLFDNLDDRFYIARAADWLGAAWGMNGQTDKLIQLSQQSLTLRRALGDQFGVASSLMNLAHEAIEAGQYMDAERYLEEMGTIYHEMGSRGWIIRHHAYLAWVAFQLGNFQKAHLQAEAALEMVTNTGTFASEGGSLALKILGLLAALEEDYARSWELCKRAHFEVGPPQHIADATLAAAACGLEDFPAARHYLLRALETDVTVHNNAGMAFVLPVAASILMHEHQPQQAVELLGLAFHHPASPKRWLQEWHLLTRLRAVLQAELSPDVYAAAWERGAASDLETVAHLLVEQFQPTQEDSADSVAAAKVRAANRSQIEPLSDRELDVLRLLASGLSNREIAGRLFIGESTVKKHINHIYGKLGASSRTQASVLAGELNLL